MHVRGLVEIDVNDDPEDPKIIYFRDVLNEYENKLDKFILIKFHKISSFGYNGMLGLDHNLIMQNIVTYPNAKPIKQKLRNFNPTQYLLIKYEFQKHLKAHFIESIDYTKWVSNMVPINQYDGRISICMYFYDLNKVYPKDEFPLPNIDILVDNTASYAMLSLMDNFLGYNQIWVNPDD